eukprot:4909997-Prymnesium_polylepis.2
MSYAKGYRPAHGAPLDLRDRSGNRSVPWTVRARLHTTSRLALLSAVCVQPGDDSCFQFKRNSATGGYGVVTSEPFYKNELVMLGPCVQYSVFQHPQACIDNGWTGDFMIYHKGAGCYFGDTFPSFANLYPPGDFTLGMSASYWEVLTAIPAEGDEGALYPWRREDAPPPSDMKKWYLMDHSSEPPLRIRKSLARIKCGDSDYRSVVFEAVRDIAPGEWLTYAYEEHPKEWCSLARCRGCI